MIGAAVIGGAVASALLLAASLRLPSLVSTLCAAYVFGVSDLVAVTVVLSPFRLVSQPGVGACQGVVLAASGACWWLRGRPLPELRALRGAVFELGRSPVALGFAALVLAALAYELLLGLSTPPNNWDSLTYHLARVADWLQFGGWHWIPNAPTDALNARQPVAEQEILFLFAATRSGALFALPQFVAELAILVAVYGCARRLGLGVSRSVSAVGLFASFSLVALEASTAQNDLVAASFPVVAACLVLGGTRTELALAGAALGVGVGVKLTSVLVWPVLAVLAGLRGRQALRRTSAGFMFGFAAIGCWGYVLNVIHTGRPLGQGRFSLDVSASPSFPGSLHTSLHLLYRLFDLSVLSDTLIQRLAIVGLIAAVLAALHGYRGGGLRKGALEAAWVSVPLLSPLLVIGGSELFGYLAHLAGLKVRVSGFAGGLDRSANEDYSAFGPLGTVTLLGLPLLVLGGYLARRLDAAKLALAASLPLFVVLLGLDASYNPFLTRFVLVPAALGAPLLALLFRYRAAGAAFLAVSAITLYLTLANDATKPLHATYGSPWDTSQVEAMLATGSPQVSPSLAAYDRLVPPSACVGAVLGSDEPSYLLYGPHFGHRIFYLPPGAGLDTALLDGLYYVVVTTGPLGPAAAGQFVSAGWKLEPLAGYWQLAVAPHAAADGTRCASL